MSNELDLDLDLDLDSIEQQTDKKLKVKNRFQELSEKVKLTAQEKEELAKQKDALEAEKTSISKERDFYKDFSVNVSKYPQAAEYQDKILEKVRGGYSTEDAMVAVLNKEGKLLPPTPEAKPRPQAEGGSAPTSLEGTGEPKSLDEKRAFLLEAEKRGDLVAALRGGRS